MREVRSNRALTVFAAGFLLLDGVLFLMMGVWARRPGLLAWGVVFVLGAIGVVGYWRYHVRRLQEIRDALQAEALEWHQLQRDSNKHP